jgi:hypothetical protein
VQASFRDNDGKATCAYFYSYSEKQQHWLPRASSRRDGMSDEPKRKWWNWRRREVPSVAPPHADLPPISREDLKSLFDSLSRPDPDPCTHTVKETKAFLRGRGLPVEETLRWLQ